MRAIDYKGFIAQQTERGITVSKELRDLVREVYRKEQWEARPLACRLGLHWHRARLLTSIEAMLNGYTYCARCFRGYF